MISSVDVKSAVSVATIELPVTWSMVPPALTLTVLARMLSKVTPDEDSSSNADPPVFAEPETTLKSWFGSSRMIAPPETSVVSPVMTTSSAAEVETPSSVIVPPAFTSRFVPSTPPRMMPSTSYNAMLTPDASTTAWKSFVVWIREISATDMKSASPAATIEVMASWSIVPPASMLTVDAEMFPSVSADDSSSSNADAPEFAVAYTVASSWLSSSRMMSPPEVSVVMPEMLTSSPTPETPSSVIVPATLTSRLVPSTPPRMISFASYNEMFTPEASTTA